MAIKNKFFLRFYELRKELVSLLSNEKPDFTAHFNDSEWCAKVAYLTDIFSSLNNLNESMQEKEKYVLTSSEKLKRFLKKTSNREITHRKKNFKISPLTFDVDQQGDITRKKILNYFMTLKDKTTQYFLNISGNKYDRVRNPHVVLSKSPVELFLEQEE